MHWRRMTGKLHMCHMLYFIHYFCVVFLALGNYSKWPNQINLFPGMQPTELILYNWIRHCVPETCKKCAKVCFFWRSFKIWCEKGKLRRFVHNRHLKKNGLDKFMFTLLSRFSAKMYKLVPAHMFTFYMCLRRSLETVQFQIVASVTLS
jgi:hypothetical protein